MPFSQPTSGRLSHELKNLNDGLGLESLIQARKQELNKLEKAITRANENLETIRAMFNSLNQEKTKLEASIKETRESVGSEIARIIPLARDTISQLEKELRSEVTKVVEEVSQLRDKSLEFGKEVGRYEGVVEANAWLKEMLALMQGGEGIDAKHVMVIALSVVRGLCSWMRMQNKNSIVVTPLSKATDNLIWELGKWNV